jgi:Fe-S cluster assembly iron-binding protein IscA
VIIKVTAPNKNIVSIDQITPTGEGVRLGYSTTITTGGPLWNQDGDYSITIQQSGGNCTLVGGTSSDDREHDRDAKWSCSAGTVQGFAQFMENKYNHVVRVAITSGTTSETSVSMDYTVEHDEYYVSGQNVPTAKDMKKLKLTADGIQGSTTINVSGTTDKSDEVIIKVTAPNKNIVSIDQITPTGEGVRLGYSTTITTGGPLWNQDGDYSITIQQSGGNCTLVGGTSSDDREHDRDAKWSCSAGTVQGFAQFMENKYNHVVRVAITSGTTSETSVSMDYTVEHDEYYVSGQNVPTAKDMKKLKLTADGIQGSTTINVSGTTDKSDEVIIKVTAPNGNIVAIDQITPTGGSFATTIETGGPLWSQDGTYTVKARQGPTDMSSFAIAEGSTTDCNTPIEESYKGLTSSATTEYCKMIVTQNNFKAADDVRPL